MSITEEPSKNRVNFRQLAAKTGNVFVKNCCRPPRGGVSRNYVSTIGVKRDKNAGGIWFAGMDEAIKRLRPSHVVRYGGDIGYKFPCGVSYIANHNTERFGEKN